MHNNTCSIADKAQALQILFDTLGQIHEELENTSSNLNNLLTDQDPNFLEEIGKRERKTAEISDLHFLRKVALVILADLGGISPPGSNTEETPDLRPNSITLQYLLSRKDCDTIIKELREKTPEEIKAFAKTLRPALFRFCQERRWDIPDESLVVQDLARLSPPPYPTPSEDS